MNNTQDQIDRFEAMRIGWRRRSAIILDGIGCPRWLVARRCPSRLIFLEGELIDHYIDNTATIHLIFRKRKC